MNIDPISIGMHRGLDAATYHATEALSSGGAKRLLRSPAHFRLERDHPSEPTAAMVLGQVVHCGVLEPDALSARVAVLPDVNKRTKHGKAMLLEFVAANAGRILLDADEHERARHAIDAVLAHATARRLLEKTEREVSLFWTDGQYGTPCKARFDAWDGSAIIDLKTADNASPETFARQAASLFYHCQAAAYWSGHEHVLAKSPDFFVFVVVEVEPPYAVACYEIKGAELQTGMRLWDEANARYRDALASGEWRGYDPRVLPLALPRWALRDNYQGALANAA